MLTTKAIDQKRFEKLFESLRLVVNAISNKPATIRYTHAMHKIKSI